MHRGSSRIAAPVISAALVLGSLLIGGPAFLAQFGTGAVLLVLGLAFVARGDVAPAPATLLLLSPALMGCLQILFRVGGRYSAGVQVLHWLVVALVAMGCSSVFRRPAAQEMFLHSTAWSGGVLCLFSTLQYYTSNGDVFWLWPSGDPMVFGPFLSRNNYASVAVLLLPLLLWKALDGREIRPGWLAMAGITFGSVIVSGSRAGALLATMELPLFAILSRRRSSTWQLLVASLLLIASAAAVGWDALAWKLRAGDPFRHRKEMMLSGVAMVKDRPWYGHGLGSYPEKYGAYATFDTGLNVNFAHNDWVQLAAEAGIPTAVTLLLFAGLTARASLQNPWALGVPIVFLHALVDYPLQRLGVALWVFAFAGVALSCDASSSRLRASSRVADAGSAPSSADTDPAGEPECSLPQRPVPVSRAPDWQPPPRQPTGGIRR
jgi:hypothetical protein